MSYVVSIARFTGGAVADSRGEALPIDPDEWRSLVEADLTLHAEEPFGTPGQLVRWLAHSTGSPTEFIYQPDGFIHIYHPDEPTVQKALEMARALGARVRGEEGEFFDEIPAARTGCAATFLAAFCAIACLSNHYLA